MAVSKWVCSCDRLRELAEKPYNKNKRINEWLAWEISEGHKCFGNTTREQNVSLGLMSFFPDTDPLCPPPPSTPQSLSCLLNLSPFVAVTTTSSGEKARRAGPMKNKHLVRLLFQPALVSPFVPGFCASFPRTKRHDAPPLVLRHNTSAS
ncbi:hypothetical protein J6590_004361 [Homalodisca vitripennis]|nr:hypothetical protein J6590_004361 [Homalodisca vitripennis]